MSKKSIHSIKVHIAEVGEECQRELAEILRQHPPQPLIICIGERYYGLVEWRLSEAEEDGCATHQAGEAPGCHKPAYGELKSALEKIASRLQLEDGMTVPSARVLWITNELGRQGLDVNFETVRSKLRNMGYYTERNTERSGMFHAGSECKFATPKDN